MDTKKRTQLNVNEIVDRLRIFTECDSDMELSRYFGFKSESQFALFRQRGRISADGMEAILAKIGGRINLNWLFWGRGPVVVNSNGQLAEQYSAMLVNIMELLGFSPSSPEVRTIGKQFNEIIRSVDTEALPREVIQAEVKEFMAELFKVVLMQV